jgi:hypothetical protein
MTYIKYCKEKSKKGSSDSTIGINSKGRFAFYKPVVQKYLSERSYIELLYDPDTKKIGIIPLMDATENAFRIQGKTTKMVIAKKFLNKFKIQIENKRYEFREDDQMLVIQI